MIEFNDYRLSDYQVERFKELRARRLIKAYIDANGTAPDRTEDFYVIDNDELEEYRKLQYAIYLAKYKKIPFKNINKICDYLYVADCVELDYEFANRYFSEQKFPVTGGCSAMRSGNWFGRNFDWYYNHDADFVIRTPRAIGRYASIGIAGCTPALSMEVVDSGTFIDAYKIFPFYLLDGINEKGVFVNDNVVPASDMSTRTTGTTPLKTKKGEICMNMLPRFVLDNYDSAWAAIQDIRDHYSVYSTKSDVIGDYEVHYIIGDENETYVVELFNNELYYEKFLTDGGKLPIMTNFYIKGINLLDGKIGNVGDNLSNLTPHGSGVDRYNILVDHFEDAGLGKDNMVNAMKDVWYSKTYDRSNAWYSEFVGSTDYVDDPDKSKGTLLSMSSPASHFEPIFDIIDGVYDNRSRDDASVWHTTHTSVYDIENRRLHLLFQENEIENKEYVFEIVESFSGWGREDGKDY